MIRLMNADDKEVYFDMSRQFYLSGATHGQIDDNLREKFWHNILEDIFVRGYILETDGNTAGYALTVPYYSQEFGGKILWVDELFVLPEFRGRGIARSFFEFAQSVESTVLLRLEAEPKNVRAVELYKSLGFEALDYLQMIKKI